MKNIICGIVLGIVIMGLAYQPERSHAVYSEYTENDPDFQESNYQECYRLGDTEFFGIIKPDGSVVILEEDMKWTIDKGADLDAITERLEGFEDKIISLREDGQVKYSNQMWVTWATDAINGEM